MTTTASTTAASRLSALSFVGILRSEWIKLFSLRSTYWCYGIFLFLTVSLAMIFVASGYMDGLRLDYESAQAIAVQSSTLGIGFGQLVVVVLGALVITGEYGTGMIRSTFAAVPSRIPAVLGKAMVFGVVTFVLALVSIAAGAFLSASRLAEYNIHTDFGDPKLWLAFIGAAGYLALLGVLAVAVGTLIRHSAGAIAIMMAMVLVVPGIISLFAEIFGEQWLSNTAKFLPSNAGSRMFEYVTETTSGDVMGMTDGIVLEPWQGFLVLFGWSAVVLAAAFGVLKVRDA
jgi:ABC-2 type transport system permease protein